VNGRPTNTCELCSLPAPWLVWETYGRFCRPCAVRLRCARHLPDHELRFLEFAAQQIASGRCRFGEFTAIRRLWLVRNPHLPPPALPRP